MTGNNSDLIALAVLAGAGLGGIAYLVAGRDLVAKALADERVRQATYVRGCLWNLGVVLAAVLVGASIWFASAVFIALAFGAYFGGVCSSLFWRGIWNKADSD